MKERNALAVANVESLLLVAILQQLQPSIGQHTITIHQQQLDASGAAFDIRDMKI
jgi:hypothetical protein